MAIAGSSSCTVGFLSQGNAVAGRRRAGGVPGFPQSCRLNDGLGRGVGRVFLFPQMPEASGPGGFIRRLWPRVLDCVRSGLFRSVLVHPHLRRLPKAAAGSDIKVLT